MCAARPVGDEGEDFDEEDDEDEGEEEKDADKETGEGGMCKSWSE